MAQTVKNLPVMQKTRVQSLVWEDLLEKGIATHSNILAWRIPWTEEPGGLQSMESQRVGHNWATNTWLRKHSDHTGLLLSKQYSSPSLFCQHSKALRIQQCEWMWRETMQEKLWRWKDLNEGRGMCPRTAVQECTPSRTSLSSQDITYSSMPKRRYDFGIRYQRYI